MILATLETPNFTFTGLAKTQPEAERMIKAYWRIHCETTGAALSYFETWSGFLRNNSSKSWD